MEVCDNNQTAISEDFVPSAVSSQISAIFDNVAAQLPTLSLSDDDASDGDDDVSDCTEIAESLTRQMASHVTSSVVNGALPEGEDACSAREMVIDDLLTLHQEDNEVTTEVMESQSIGEGRVQENDEMTISMSRETDSVTIQAASDMSRIPDVSVDQPAAVPVHLSLGELESVDLDALLANLADAGGSYHVEDSSGQPIAFERPQSSSLMDRLSQLSVEQSKERWNMEHLGQQSHQPSDENDAFFRDSNRKEKTDDIGLWKEMVGKKESEPKERSTVMLDLRPSQCKLGPVRESQMPELLRDMLGLRLTLENDSESPDSDSDDDLLSWHQYRHEFKSLNLEPAVKENGHTETRTEEHVPVVVAKRPLKPAIKQNEHTEIRAEENVAVTKRPLRRRTVLARQRESEEKLETESENKGSTSECQSIPQEAVSVCESVVCEANGDHQAESSKAGVNNNEGVVGNKEHRETQRQKSQAEWKRKEKQRKKRQELERKTEENRPVTSVSSSHPSAVNSPLLYDMEASFDDPVSSLPTDCLSNYLALLSVQLSASISLPYSTPQTCVLAAYHSLVVLVSWLLSLVHINRHLGDQLNGHSDTDNKEPFNVVGCEIVVCGGCPYLVVGITSTTEDSGLSAKHNGVFIKEVTSFLQKTNLSKIYHKLFLSHSSTACCFPNSNVDLSASDFTVSLSTFISITDDPITANKVFNSLSGFYSVTLDVGFEYANLVLPFNPILSNVQTSVSAFGYELLHRPQQLATTLLRVFQSGLSLSGLRLVYETGNKEPKLVIVVRGNNAIVRWIEEIGPSDPILARTTDPSSLRALFGGDLRSSTLISCVRSEMTSRYETVYYMGDRVNEIDSVTTSLTHSVANTMKKSGLKLQPFPGCLHQINNVLLPKIVCHTTSNILLICSPFCPVTAMGDILQTCSDRGFAVAGLKRQRLNKHKGKKLSFVDANQLKVFTPVSMGGNSHPPMPSLIISLVKENASIHVYSLIQCLVTCFHSDQSCSCHFHAVNPTESVSQMGLAEFSSMPSHDCTIGLVVTTSYTRSLPQPLFITLAGHRAVASIGKLLCDLFSEAKQFQKTGTVSKDGAVFELVGIKVIPLLSSYLAKQITPFEIGSSQWQASIRSLCNKPTAFILVRSINGTTEAMKVLNNLSLAKDEALLCASRQEVVRLTSLVFKDSELSFDVSCHTLTEYLPARPSLSTSRGDVTARIPGRRRWRKTDDQHVASVQESVLNSLVMPPVDLTTVAVLKPHIMQKHMATILNCLTNAGFSVVGMDIRRLTVVEAEMLIRDRNVQNDMSLHQLADHVKEFTSGPSLVLCLMAVNGVKWLLDCLGHQNPKQARELDPCSLRATYGVDEIHNGIYASSSYRDAIDDMKLLFPHGLCCPLSPILQDEGIHCPAIGVVVTESKSNRHSQNEGNGDDTAVNTINRDNGVNASTSECNENITVSPRRDIVNDHYQQPVSHIVNPPRSLKQTTCIVFPSCLVNEMGHDKVSKLVYVDMIRGLVTKCGFCPIAMKMVWFSAEEAGHFALMKECSGQTDRFTAGPCVAIALERDNAIVCFDVLVDSCLLIKQLFSKYRDKMVISQTNGQAATMLQFLFTVVYPGLTQEVYLQ